MRLSREYWSCQVTWHVSTWDAVSCQRAPCEWMFCFAAGFLCHHCVHTMNIHNNICQDFSCFSSCDQVYFPLLCVCVCVCVNGCVLTKPQCSIIYQPGERCCSHLISPPTCVLIVPANFALCRQVRCKCGWFEMHFLTKENGREKGNCQSYPSCVTVALVYFHFIEKIFWIIFVLRKIRLLISHVFKRWGQYGITNHRLPHYRFICDCFTLVFHSLFGILNRSLMITWLWCLNWSSFSEDQFSGFYHINSAPI